MSYPKLTQCSCRYGAPMGRPDITPDHNNPIKLHLRKLRWVDGDYDEGAAYWGYVRGEHIYRAVGYGKEELNELFVRAKSREDARKQVLEVFPRAKFYR